MAPMATEILPSTRLPPTFQPQTSYRWAKLTDRPNPVLSLYENKLEGLNSRLRYERHEWEHGQRLAHGLRRDARFAPSACGITKAGKPLPTPTSPPFTHRRHARVEFFGHASAPFPEVKPRIMRARKASCWELVAALLI
jgi:hypothetical protein